MTMTQDMVKAMYKDSYGNPIELTPGQDDIFSSIFQRKYPRVHTMCFTRYGKSMTVGIAVISRASTFPEKWFIGAGTKEKSKIIMEYVIAHIFDNDWTKGNFVPDKGETVDEIRRHRNKQHITFKTGETVDPLTGRVIPLYGEVFIGGAKDALGFGAANVILDEAALVDDPDFSMVLRMLGDNPKDNFLCKIGNPFNRNHFLNSYHDPAYHKIVVDCYKGLEEGRITQETIDENKPYPYFRILYECKFPSATEISEDGWMQLLTDNEIKIAQERILEPYGVRMVGVDIARAGRNYNSHVMRTDNYAKVLQKDLDPDLISTGDTIINECRDNGIADRDTFIDDSGVGGGVTDYLKSRQFFCKPVNFGESASDRDYLNVRAECYAGKEGLQAWVKRVGRLEPHKDWIEGTKIRYKKDYTGRIKIEPKEDMRKKGIESPDTIDALALTFAISTKSVYSGINPAFVAQGGLKPYYQELPA